MELRIYAKRSPLLLLTKIEEFLESAESKTWELDERISVRKIYTPVFTHKSNQYYKKAGIFFQNVTPDTEKDDPYILLKFRYIDDEDVETEYIGMITSMLLRQFENKIYSIEIF